MIEAVLTCTHNICFEQKYENSKKNQLKIVIFTAVKKRCLLHGRVFVMFFDPPAWFMSDLVGNPEDRFSFDMAQMRIKRFCHEYMLQHRISNCKQ